MEKRIVIISLVVLLSVGLILSDNIEFAYAFSHVDINNNGSNNYTYYNENNKTLYLLSSANTISRITVTSSGQTLVADNVAIPTSGTNDITGLPFNLGTGTYEGLWCGITHCYTQFTNGTADVFVRTSITMTTLSSFVNYGSTRLEPEFTGFDEVSGGFGSVTIWFVRQCSGADTDRIGILFNGITMTESGTLNNVVCSGGTDGFGANNINDIYHNKSDASNPRRLFVTDNSAGGNFWIFNLSTNSQVCSDTISFPDEIEAVKNEVWTFTTGASGDIHRRNVSTCANIADITDITLTTTGFSLIDMNKNNARKEVYIQNNKGIVVTVNMTDFTKVWDYQTYTDAIDGMWNISINGTNKIAITHITNPTRFIILDIGIPDEDQQISDFCSIAGNEDLLACFETEPLVGASELINESFFDIFVQIGLIDGSNTNCATNGVGYYMVSIALGIMIGIFWIASRGDLTNIPTFIWFISTLAIVSAITIMDCLDPVWFLIAIIAIIALAVAKTKTNLFGSFIGE